MNLSQKTDPVENTEHIIDLGARPHCPSGWRIERHRSGGAVRLERQNGDLYLDGKKIGFYISENQRKRKGITGQHLRDELRSQPVLNANVLDYLEKHPYLVPETWKKDPGSNRFSVFFWGTEYRDVGDFLCIRHIRYGTSGFWGWFSRWIETDDGTQWVDYTWRPNHLAAVLVS